MWCRRLDAFDLVVLSQHLNSFLVSHCLGSHTANRATGIAALAVQNVAQSIPFVHTLRIIDFQYDGSAVGQVGLTPLSALGEHQSSDYQPRPKVWLSLCGLTRLQVRKPPAYQKSYQVARTPRFLISSSTSSQLLIDLELDLKLELISKSLQRRGFLVLSLTNHQQTRVLSQ